MNTTIRNGLIAIAACLTLTPALAQGTANVRFYSMADDGADLTLDGQTLRHVDNGNVYFFTMTPGSHALHAKTGNGDEMTATLALDENAMAEARGRKWWCVVFGRRTADKAIILRLAEQSLCQNLLSQAPPDDVPGDQ